MFSKSIPILAPIMWVFWLVACGPGDTSGSSGAAGGGGTGGGTTASGGTGGTTSSTGGIGGTTNPTGGTGGTSTGGGGGTPVPPSCVKSCQTAADCKADNGAFNAGNFACNAGNCEYKGCKTDAECATTFANPIYVCGNDPAYLLPTCVKSCQSAADCKTDAGAFDADNYSCSAGECHYLGCKTDAKCATTFNTPTYVCASTPPYPVPFCAKSCQSVGDCQIDMGAFSSDNYACKDGACLYTGCKTDMECATTFSNDQYVCP